MAERTLRSLPKFTKHADHVDKDKEAARKKFEKASKELASYEKKLSKKKK